jgi:8-hydroxy-5-deazaflavin:NADPH oxidoreductase
MATVTIFGDGNMGSAIAAVLGATASVEHITTSTENGTVNGDVVVLAVPHPAVSGILDTYADQLAGKTIVDITNPLDFQTFDSLVVPADSSAAAEIAAALPSSRVLKAFNTTFAAALAAKEIGPNPTTVLVAGDDETAKSELINAITAGGVQAVDVGPLKRARELEAVGFLQLTLAVAEKVGWNHGFALVR